MLWKNAVAFRVGSGDRQRLRTFAETTAFERVWPLQKQERKTGLLNEPADTVASITTGGVRERVLMPPWTPFPDVAGRTRAPLLLTVPFNLLPMHSSLAVPRAAECGPRLLECLRGFWPVWVVWNWEVLPQRLERR